jgi:hypothetical protein
MKRFLFAIASVLLCTIASVAQTIPNEGSGHGIGFVTQDTSPATHAVADDRPESDAPSAILSTVSRSAPPKFAPSTRSERFRSYLIRVAGPQPFITAAATAGFSQAEGRPKEWGGGAEEYGVSSALHEDNRYFVSGQAAFFRRTKYAVLTTLLARHDNGDQSFSFSHIGSAAGAAFISRALGSRAAPPARQMVRLALAFPWAPTLISTFFVSFGRA